MCRQVLECTSPLPLLCAHEFSIAAYPSVLPAATVVSEIANQRLAAMPFENGRYTERLAVIYRKNRKLTPAMKEFILALKCP